HRQHPGPGHHGQHHPAGLPPRPGTSARTDLAGPGVRTPGVSAGRRTLRLRGAPDLPQRTDTSCMNTSPTEKFRTSVGGQALMEGIMMRGPQRICCAVHRPDGNIDLTEEPVTTPWYNRVPLVRGVCNRVHSLFTGYK